MEREVHKHTCSPKSTHRNALHWMCSEVLRSPKAEVPVICSHPPIEGSHDIFGQAFSNLPRVAYALLHIPFVVRVLRLVGFGCGLWVLVCGLGFWVVGWGWGFGLGLGLWVGVVGGVTYGWVGLVLGVGRGYGWDWGYGLGICGCGGWGYPHPHTLLLGSEPTHPRTTPLAK